MNTVLVTGANGFVGNHLVKELAENGYRVVGVSGKGGLKEESLHISKHLALDLTKPSETKSIDFKKVDCIIHLAGLAAVRDSFNEPMKYIQTNMGIELNLFEAALSQNSYPKFLIISSGSLYDPKAGLPLTENSEILPTSPYAVSKIGQEQLARYYMSRGFECVIVRPFNHIGPGQGPGFIAPDLALQIIQAKASGKKDIAVGNLATKRDYTDVRDIVRAYRLLLEKGKSGEVYNVCSSRAYSGQQLLNGLVRAAGIKVNPKPDPLKNRPADNPIIYGDYTKLQQATEWKPEISLEKTLADIIGSL